MWLLWTQKTYDSTHLHIYTLHPHGPFRANQKGSTMQKSQMGHRFFNQNPLKYAVTSNPNQKQIIQIFRHNVINFNERTSFT